MQAHGLKVQTKVECNPEIIAFFQTQHHVADEKGLFLFRLGYLRRFDFFISFFQLIFNANAFIQM